MNGPPRGARGDDAHEPPRPYVPRRDQSRPRGAFASQDPRGHAPAPPFSGRGASDAGDASAVVHVRGESAFGPRDRAAERSVPRRWQAIEIGFEEWGRGALVLVGMPRPPARAAGRQVGDSTPRSDGVAPPPTLGDKAPGGGAISDDDTRDEVETVALALETIALRVRVGEFRVRGLVPGMSDPAILAATLASILAPRP